MGNPGSLIKPGLRVEALTGPDAELWLQCERLGIVITNTDKSYWAWTSSRTPKKLGMDRWGFMSHSDKDWQTPAREVLAQYLFCEELAEKKDA